MSTQTLAQADQHLASAPIKVLVSRPAAARAARPPEVHGPECCWTRAGEILIPALVGCDPRPGHAEWGFTGMASASAATWAVVETRSVGEVASAVVGGQYADVWGEEDDFPGFVFDDIREVGARIRDLPVGSVVGIFGPTQQAYSLYDRTPAPPRNRI
jgi:hypothetical protein